MGYFFVDDSLHDKAGFVIGACVFSSTDLVDEVVDLLRENGLSLEKFEFKSNTIYLHEPSMIRVRDKLKELLRSSCKLGVVIVPWMQREELGLECLKGLRQFIRHNKIKQPIEIYFDQGMFKSNTAAIDLISVPEFENCLFHFEQNSKLVYGIQMADLAAHVSSIQLKEALGLVTKSVKAGKNSGYDQDLSIPLGFEMWATVRNTFFTGGTKDLVDKLPENATLEVEPYGLYISEYCGYRLANIARSKFGTMYLGCIH